MNTYLDLCTQVYELSKPTPPQEAYQFYRSYAAAVNGLLLEPMCGTGRFLLPLVAEGFTVHGFDASKPMLDRLYAKAKAQKLKVKVWQGLVKEINVQEKYNLIFIPSGSFGLITDLQEAKEALKIFYNLLTNEGMLLFEAETLQAIPLQLGVSRSSVWTREDGQFILANFLDLTAKNNLVSTLCRYELVAGNTLVKTEIEILKLRLYEPEKLCSLLTEVGFTKIKQIKAFHQNKQPDREDQVIIYECRK